MNVVVAIDSFKGSLSSLEAGMVIKDSITKVLPDAKVSVRPLADGGEGTVEALTLGMGGKLETVTVTGPLDNLCHVCLESLQKAKLQLLKCLARLVSL